MEAQTYAPRNYHLDYSVRQPALTIEPGAVITTQLVDAHGCDAKGDTVAGRPNPLTGPFVIPGAMPGDTLSVRLHTLQPNRSDGFACKDIHPVMQAPPRPFSDRRKEYVTWTLDLERMTASPPEEYSPGWVVVIPITPVLGCIGVAAHATSSVPSQDCGTFGGNMDYPRITAGCTVHLPVLVPGGYLYLGDCHAIQGAGEITGNGVEVSADVAFSVRISKFGMQSPAGEDEQYIFTIGNAKPLEQAARIATAQMGGWLENAYGLHRDQVGILMGQLVSFEIGNLVSNRYTAACCFPKKYLPVRA